MMNPMILAWVTWNTLLALIPVYLAFTISWLDGLRIEGRKRVLARCLMLILGLVWLAFLPNTCYLLTEWRHFLATLDRTRLYELSQYDPRAAFLLMTYTFFYLCYSAVGLLTFTLSIRPIARMARKMGATMWVWGSALFILMSLGVYLGLVLRFNSWNLLNRPGEVWASTKTLPLHPLSTTFIVAFGGFLWLAYVAIDIWIDGFLTRWKAHFGAKDGAEA
jgi:uncharacterized membrane protein